ncbi:hypothetical protein [Pseudomonas cannabina]|uniref:Rha family transcriptional regulator n=1 Tax=Pseudomonas cannabina TaxID=86840 RepID=A0A0P9N1H6_PSECA|nr:hypothetical protein [Pseudomonas cannabina]KAA8718230.1 hypothetical protein F4W70_03380 [Pseudomonas cannabina]KPW65019.1 hypothetical protein ALO81_200323 [Pseudomonas cannabina]RMN36630.1 hypothetical protein ALQ64_01002 [Pseudomonas cannabina]SDR41252.1 hypothetical protein SAMN05216597_4445 [Pseudomonas cannabina]
MTINKNWIVRDDRTSYVNTLTVAGLVPTSASHSFPMLNLSTKQSEAGQLKLDLTYYATGLGPWTGLEAPVTYTQPSDPTITTVCVYQDDELLVSIDNITVIN